MISVGLAAGVSVGTQKLGSFGFPFSGPEPSLGLEEEEEELVLELVVASSGTLLTLGARVCAIGGRGGGVEKAWWVECMEEMEGTKGVEYMVGWKRV